MNRRFRWSLKTMMVAVAVLAVCVRWPILGIAGSLLFCGVGPVLGVWLARGRGAWPIFRGSITWGVGASLVWGVVFFLAASSSSYLCSPPLRFQFRDLVSILCIFGGLGVAHGTLAGAYFLVFVPSLRGRIMDGRDGHEAAGRCGEDGTDGGVGSIAMPWAVPVKNLQRRGRR